MEPISKEADTHFSKSSVISSIQTTNTVRILSSLTRTLSLKPWETNKEVPFIKKLSGSYLILEVSSHSLPSGRCRPHTGEFQAEAVLGQC